MTKEKGWRAKIEELRLFAPRQYENNAKKISLLYLCFVWVSVSPNNLVSLYLSFSLFSASSLSRINTFCALFPTAKQCCTFCTSPQNAPITILLPVFFLTFFLPFLVSPLTSFGFFFLECQTMQIRGSVFCRFGSRKKMDRDYVLTGRILLFLCFRCRQDFVKHHVSKEDKRTFIACTRCAQFFAVSSSKKKTLANCFFYVTTFFGSHSACTL